MIGPLEQRKKRQMKTLIVEDDIDSARILASYLSDYSDCEIVTDGRQALYNVELAFREEEPFDLVCLDIMMPNMDGQQALKRIRDIEFKRGIMPGKGARIVMVSALSDNDNILHSFVNLSDGYLVKPYSKAELFDKLRELRLIRG